jgi:outer membrane protein
VFKGSVVSCMLVCSLAGGTAGLAAGAGTPAAAGSTLAAQGLSLTFESALDLAGRNNKTYLRQVQREQAASAALWEAGLAFGPTASLQAGYVLDNKPQSMSVDFGAFGGPASVQEMQLATNYYSGQISVSQPIFTGGKIVNAFRLAGLQYDTARDETRLARGQLYQDVTQVYYGVVVSEKLLSVMETSLRQLNQHLDVVKARYREGAASDYDLLRSEVEVANLEPTVIKIRNAAILARRSLAAALGADMSQEIKTSGTLPIVEETWPVLEEMQRLAHAQRLELKNLERAQGMAEIGSSLALASNAPNLALTGNWTYWDTVDAQFPPDSPYLKHAWQVGVGLSWPFWDNLSAIPKMQAAAAKAREVELGRQALEDGIKIEVESAYLSLTSALQTLKAQKQNAALAAEGYRLAERRYANGVMTNLDVMDAQLALNQAESNYLQTQYECILSRIKLHRALGDNL